MTNRAVSLRLAALLGFVRRARGTSLTGVEIGARQLPMLELDRRSMMARPLEPPGRKRMRTAGNLHGIGHYHVLTVSASDRSD